MGKLLANPTRDRLRNYTSKNYPRKAAAKGSEKATQSGKGKLGNILARADGTGHRG
ncbi:MAG: hypothetical protein AAF685_10090 [Cyanobacteria bacterium P01_C01_bin.89]